MRVDDRDRDRRPRQEAELARRRLRQPAGPLADRPHRSPHARKPLVRERGEPHLPEVSLVPSAIVAEVGPLAGRGAERSRVVPGRAVAEEIGEIEEAGGAAERRGHVLGEPAELRRLHLRRDHPADVAEHLVPGGVDARRLRDRAVVDPHDHVPAILAASVTGADRHRPVGLVQEDQRAGRVEADACRRGPARCPPARGPRASRRRTRPRCRRRTARRNPPRAGGGRWGERPSRASSPPRRRARRGRCPCPRRSPGRAARRRWTWAGRIPIRP